MLPKPFIRAADPPVAAGLGQSSSTQAEDWPVLIRYTLIPLSWGIVGNYSVLNSPGWFAYIGPGTRLGLNPWVNKADNFYMAYGVRVVEEFIPVLPKLVGQAWPPPTVYGFTWEEKRPAAYRYALHGFNLVPEYAHA